MTTEKLENTLKRAKRLATSLRAMRAVAPEHQPVLNAAANMLETLAELVYEKLVATKVCE